MRHGKWSGGRQNVRRLISLTIMLLLALLLLSLAGCRGTSAPAAMPTVTPTPTLGAFPALTPVAARGGAFWPQSPCAACHGLTAAGISGNGPALRGQKLDPAWTWEMLRGGFRYGAALPHPTFAPQLLSDRQIIDIVAWLNQQSHSP